MCVAGSPFSIWFFRKIVYTYRCKIVAGDDVVIGVGIDIIEIKRIKAAIAREAFVERVFTSGEAAYCRSRGVQQAASFAARFAAKEAVAKALGSGFAGGNIRDIEVVAGEGGKPIVVLHDKFACLAARLGVTAIHISLTHAQEYAAAQAVLEGGDK
ncbi:hypothetical protein SRRS_16660 [Sporomusa rhizae]